jgi:ATP-dependent helicase HepA
LLGLQLAQAGRHSGLSAVLGARVEWLPHQVDVAMRALSKEPIRMLLADEVGLGKTVEAALIYAGLRQQGRADRVLILTPDALAIQWLGEIFRKDHELLVLMDKSRLADAQQDFPGLNPFEAHQRMVASLDRLAADPVLAHFAEAAPWDLVIIDEAHHLRWDKKTKGNAAYRLAEALAAKTRHMLLLTATPMALDPTEYHVLLRLLDRGRFDDPTKFTGAAERARSLRDVAKAVSDVVDARRAVPKAMVEAGAELLGDDGDDLALWKDFCRTKVADEARRRKLEPVLAALQERHSLSDYVTRNRRGPVGGLPERRAQTFALTPTPLQETLLDVGESIMVELAQSLPPPAQRAQALGEFLRALWATPRALLDILRPYSEELVTELTPYVEQVVNAPKDASGLPSQDARLAWLVQQIHALEPADKLLVFVESGVAVKALKDALENALGQSVAAFHKEMSPRDQDRQVAYFRDAAGPQVMLCTEAGGEGRNFQFCHKVVLYDLPWRPATVEQRIGRIDRVGQRRDVHVLVPYYTGGFEAAIVKIMQQSIGVLDNTVGGIDHALEYVSQSLGELILNAADAAAWKDLYRKTQELVASARQRIEADVDPILDHASFDGRRAQGYFDAMPEDLEGRMEAFVSTYASHSKLDVAPKGPKRLVIEGAPSAAHSVEDQSFIGTFSRTDALDHEDVEFLSFGHPLVQQALEWAQSADDTSAALALCRGFAKDGAVFLWTFGLDVPQDVPEARAYFDNVLWTLAIDESGKRRPELETLLDRDGRPMDRMDPTPLRGSIERWRQLVEHNFEAAEGVIKDLIDDAAHLAFGRMHDAMAAQAKALRRQLQRLAQSTPKPGAKKAAADVHEVEAQQAAHLAQEAKLTRAIRDAQPQLMSVVAVRLMRGKRVSA